MEPFTVKQTEWLARGEGDGARKQDPGQNLARSASAHHHHQPNLKVSPHSVFPHGQRAGHEGCLDGRCAGNIPIPGVCQTRKVGPRCWGIASPWRPRSCLCFPPCPVSTLASCCPCPDPLRFIQLYHDHQRVALSALQSVPFGALQQALGRPPYLPPAHVSAQSPPQGS